MTSEGAYYVGGKPVGGYINITASASTLHDIVGAVSTALHHMGKWPVLVQENDEYTCNTRELRAMAERHGTDLICLSASTI